MLGTFEFSYGGISYKRRNILTYLSRSITAKVLSGDQTWLPQYVGFLYGPAAPGSPMPNPSSSRSHTFASLGAALLGIAGNMVISNVTGKSLATAGDTANYSDNLLQLSATSDGTGTLLFPSSGGYAAAGPVPGDDLYYQAALLSRQVAGNGITTWYPFAVVQLAAGTDGIAVLTGKELAYTWKLDFSFNE